MEFREITDPNEKSGICGGILRALPDWFGVPAAVAGYIEQARELPFYAAFDTDKPVGFAALKTHNPYTAEICVTGVLQEYHRRGIGRSLVKRCEIYCRENGMEYLTVKTLDASRADAFYEKTRQFYLSAGFRPLEVFPLFWDKDNPCLFLAKSLANAADVITRRRSTRRYKPRQTDGGLLSKVIEAGRAAQSGGNAQLTRITVIQNTDVMREIIKISKQAFSEMTADENTYKSLRNTINRAKDKDFHFDYLYSAPTLIIFTHKKGYANAMADSVCVLQNMVIAAEALGLGTCYQNPLHWLDESEPFREYMRTIGIERDETITCALTIGYSGEDPAREPLPRTGNTVSYYR